MTKYLWCLHCERTFKEGEYRINPDYGTHDCPYEGCDGDDFGDFWDWENVRKGHPDYPKTPENGKVYPLY